MYRLVQANSAATEPQQPRCPELRAPPQDGYHVAAQRKERAMPKYIIEREMFMIDPTTGES
jgi:hypothetical protein